MTVSKIRSNLLGAALSALAAYSVPTMVHATPSTELTPSSPIDGCFYGVTVDNKIAKGLKNVAVITDPKAMKDFQPDDVVYLFEKSSLVVAKGAKKSYRISGDVPQEAITSSVENAHLFVEDCHRSLKKSAGPKPFRPHHTAP
jgi:hypothetical protein